MVTFSCHQTYPQKDAPENNFLTFSGSEDHARNKHYFRPSEIDLKTFKTRQKSPPLN